MTEDNAISVIAYARVSTSDKDQNPESQFTAIRRWAKDHNMRIVMEFQDKQSGATDDRPQLERIFGWKRNHPEVTKLLILAEDRLSRNMLDAPGLIKDFHSIGLEIIYTTNENLDLHTNEGLLLHDMKVYAGAQYIDGLKAKIRAGQERARNEGKHIGRPLSRVDNFDIDTLLGFASMGYSLRDVASVYNCSRVTITRRLTDEGKLEQFKENYTIALSQGKKGPALQKKKYKPKKDRSKPSEAEPVLKNQ